MKKIIEDPLTQADVQKKKKKMLETNFGGPDLPVDIIENILTWLPTRALMRFRAVCLTWADIIDSDPFSAAHVHKSSRSLFIVYDGRLQTFFRYDSLDESRSEIVVPLPRGQERSWPGKLELWSSCNGLLLFSRHRSWDYNLASFIVGNPTTGEFVDIPSVEERGEILLCQLVKEDEGGIYKVFLLYRGRDRASVVSLVFTLGVDVSWRSFLNPYSCWSRRWCVRLFPCMNGAFHSIYDDCEYNLHPRAAATRFVAAFHIKEERIEEIKYPPCNCPPQIETSYHVAHLAELMGTLCLFHSNSFRESELVDVWFLKDYHHHDWSKDFSIDLSYVGKELRSAYPYAQHPHEKNQVLLRCVDSSGATGFVAYQPTHKTCTINRVKLLGNCCTSTRDEATTYLESLVRVRAPQNIHLIN